MKMSHYKVSSVLSLASTTGPVRPVTDKYAFQTTDKQTDKQKDIATAAAGA